MRWINKNISWSLCNSFCLLVKKNITHIFHIEYYEILGIQLFRNLWSRVVEKKIRFGKKNIAAQKIYWGDCNINERRIALITNTKSAISFSSFFSHSPKKPSAIRAGFSGTSDPQMPLIDSDLRAAFMKGRSARVALFKWHVLSPFRWLIRPSTRLQLRQSRGSDARAHVHEALRILRRTLRITLCSSRSNAFERVVST